MPLSVSLLGRVQPVSTELAPSGVEPSFLESQMVAMSALLLLGSLAVATAQAPGGPGGGGGASTSSISGQASASSCTSVSTCTTSAVNYASRSLTYSTSTGLFTGTLTINQCPSYITTFTQASASCVTQTFPAPAYVTANLPKAVGLVGTVGFTLQGMNIYNPLENGFSSGSANQPTICSTSGYYCAAGMDVDTCVQELYYTCGSAQASAVTTTVAGTTFGDTCGGHASPYHYHTDTKCEYAPNSVASASLATAHSALIGIALDGKGIYGAWESAGTMAVLDACGGHVGSTSGLATASLAGTVTPVTDLSGFASASVYHYHLSTTYPYTLGCFAANTAVNATTCRSLYQTGACNTWQPTYYANGSAYYYDDWCPCGGGSGPNGKPATAINTLPSVSGATCYTGFAGNSMGNIATGATACNVATQLGSTPASSPTASPPPPRPPPAASSSSVVRVSAAVAGATVVAATLI